MHINRPVAMQMGQMGPAGSNNASGASWSSLLFSILRSPNQGNRLMLSQVLWSAVICLSADDSYGRKRQGQAGWLVGIRVEDYGSREAAGGNEREEIGVEAFGDFAM